MLHRINPEELFNTLETTEFCPIYCGFFKPGTATEIFNDEKAAEKYFDEYSKADVFYFVSDLWGTLSDPLFGLENRDWIRNFEPTFIYKKGDKFMFLKKFDSGSCGAMIFKMR